MHLLGELHEILASRPRVNLGSWPSPVRRLEGELWVKDEGAVHPIYGGNKVRKLERILARAQATGAEEIVTFGAAGSHHLLAMGLLTAPLRVHGLVFPQVKSPHVQETLGASARSSTLHPTSGLRLPFTLARVLLERRRATGRWPMVVGPGASNAETVLAWAEAGLEIAWDIERGVLPLPRAVVVAAGSGGTAAGLWLGLALAGVPTQVHAVAVSGAPIGLMLSRLVRIAARRLGLAVPAAPGPALERAWVCGGYGRADGRVADAMAFGQAHGLAMEATYTGKALGAAAAMEGPVLYVHSLSARSPESGPVPEGLAGLLR